MKRKILVILSAFWLFQLGNNVQADEISENSDFAIHAKKENSSYYKDIKIKKSNGNYEVTGKAKIRKGVFYYMVENGHNVIVPEKKVNIDNLHWASFRINISIPDEKLPKNGALILYLYEKNKSGSMLDQQPIVLDRFNN